MRIKLSFKTEPGFEIPFNYTYPLAAMIYHKIEDLKHAQELHDQRGFKFFTFSQLQIRNREITEQGIITKDGCFNLFISAVDPYFLQSLVQGLMQEPNIDFMGAKISIDKFKVLTAPEFNRDMFYKTLSPIYLREQTVDGRTWDLDPYRHDYILFLKRNLMKKYNAYNDETIDLQDFNIDIYEDTCNLKRVTLKIRDKEFYHRAWQMHLHVEADPCLHEFLYNVGVGEKNSMGFGMLQTTKKSITQKK